MQAIIALALSVAMSIIPMDCDAPQEVQQEIHQEWSGEVITRENGTVIGPSGREAYYNLDMSGVVAIMREAGYNEEAHPYWERGDGCKMLGPYIMVAMDLSEYPRGTIVETSRGLGIVADTGAFVKDGYYQLDMAVNW